MGALLDPVIVSNIDIVVDSEVIGVDRCISDHNATMINIKMSAIFHFFTCTSYFLPVSKF